MNTAIDPFIIAIIAIVVLSLLGLPIGLAMISASILYLFVAHLDPGTAAEQLLNGMYQNWLLLAVPLFIFSAEIMNAGSITERLLAFCNALVGRFRGGLAYVNVVQAIIFAGMSGSAIADAAGPGKLMQAMMTRDGRYTPSFAAGLTASAAVIGPIIPPSIPMVLYALVSDTSIGFLFLGGVVPGLLLGLVQMIMIWIVARRRDFPVERPTPVRALPRITMRALPALLMPVILLGCIYTGVTTPTEAAAVAGAYALAVSVLLYRSLSWTTLYRSLLISARTTSSIGMLIAGALVFNYVVTIENIPTVISTYVQSLNPSPLTFMIFVNLLLLILGCLLEGTTIILIVLPVLVPTAQALGIDLVYFGVVAVVNIMLGLVTPPYGLLLFVMSNLTGVPLRAIVRETLPFLLAMIVALGVIVLVPESILWLPKLFGYQGAGAL